MVVVLAVLAIWITYYSQWRYLASQPIDKLILTAVHPEGFTPIKRNDALRYLQKGDFNINESVPDSSIPLINFCLYGYSTIKTDNNKRIFQVAQLLINRGANINAIDGKTGRTPLHEAIFFNQIELVKFLIKNKANPMIKVNYPKSVFHGSNALEFAKKIDKMDKNIDYSPVIKVVEAYQNQFLKNHTQSVSSHN